MVDELMNMISRSEWTWFCIGSCMGGFIGATLVYMIAEARGYQFGITQILRHHERLAELRGIIDAEISEVPAPTEIVTVHTDEEKEMFIQAASA